MSKNKLKTKSTGDKLTQAIKEAQKDPEFIRDVNRFIEATTKKVFKLRDLGF